MKTQNPISIDRDTFAEILKALDTAKRKLLAARKRKNPSVGRVAK